MLGIRPSNRNFCCTNEEQTRGIKYVKNIIQDLERYGPAGLIHVYVLSNIIGKSIKIWNYDGSLNRIIGKGKKGLPIDVEYHPGNSEHTQIGHWTLRHGKNPDNITVDLNSCLFSVIGFQTGQDPSRLRKESVLRLNKIEKLTHQMDEIIRLERNDGIMLMIGGARYSGQSPRDAARILNNSQNAKCYGYSALGHPRGHASNLYATGPYDSVESYAKHCNKEKTGFLSRTDQDLVAHLALTSQQATNAMQQLNRPIPMVTEHIVTEILKKGVKQFTRTLPKAKLFDAHGDPAEEEEEILKVVLVMRHHEDQEYNPEADVFVHTFYPVIN